MHAVEVDTAIYWGLISGNPFYKLKMIIDSKNERKKI
jgi:hypothetical protein